MKIVTMPVSELITLHSDIMILLDQAAEKLDILIPEIDHGPDLDSEGERTLTALIQTRHSLDVTRFILPDGLNLTDPV